MQMDRPEHRPHAFEPTPDELPAERVFQFASSRRKFLKLTGGSLVVFFFLPELFTDHDQPTANRQRSAATGQPPTGVAAWIRIGEDGTITVCTGKVEVGQNIRTSLSQIVAEELMVPVSAITMIMGDTDLVPFDMGTFGSRTTPQMGPQLRKAAATAREALIGMAAKKWNADTGNLVAENGFIREKNSQKKIGYGELTLGQQLTMPVSDQVKVVGATDWKVAGKSVRKVNERSFITGQHKYVSDMKLPGMLYGKIMRPPSYGAKLISADTSKAEAMPGVRVVKDGDFIGVAAPDIPTARKALLAIDTKWEEKAGQPTSENVFAYLVKNETGPGRGRNAGGNTGNFEKGMAEAELKHSSTHHISYIAHAPLEPRAAVARWEDGKLTVWTGTQRPFGVQQELANVFKLDKANVRVIMPDTGSGYGGKHSGETAIEAARLAQAAGKPVKVVWTREEEFTWAYFRPGGIIEIKAGVKKDGTITAWKMDNYNSGGAGLETEYRVLNKEIAYHPSDSPLRQGSYRGLAATANVFARESAMSDLARLVKMDSLDFRLRNLDDDRFKAVLQAAASGFKWARSKLPGHGFGIAGAFEKGGYVGTCVEVMVNKENEVKVMRVVQAFECGAIINPHHLENQAIGSIVQGLGGALFEAIDFANGKILNSGLSAYRVPRFTDLPKIEVILIDRKDLPSAGAGEACIVGIAPAIRNAILDATGKAMNDLPMLPKGAVV